MKFAFFRTTTLLLLGLFASQAQAYQEEVSQSFDKTVDIRIFTTERHQPLTNKPLGVTVFLQNNGEPKEFALNIRGFAHYTKRLKVGRGATQQVSLSLPATYRHSYKAREITLTVMDTRTQFSREYPIRLISRSSYYDDKTPVLMLGQFDRQPYTRSRFQDLGKIRPEFLPNHWKALANVGVMVTQLDTFKTLSNHHKTILRDWVIAGGQLVVVGGKPESVGVTHVQQHDALWGTNDAMNHPVDDDAIRMGFGFVMYTPPTRRLIMNRSFHRQLDKVSIYSEEGVDEFSRFAQSELPEVGRVDANWVMVVLLIFALLAGPIAIVRLIRRRQQPFKYLRSVIVCSLVFSAGILLTDAVLSSNSHLTTNDSFTLIDHENDRQISLMQGAIYPTRALTLNLPNNTSFTQFVGYKRGYRNESNVKYTVEDDATYQAIDGLFPARQRRAYMTKMQGKPQGRIIAKFAGSGVVVENHFQHDLNALWVRIDGRVYKVGPLAAGDVKTVSVPSARVPQEPRLGGALHGVGEVFEHYWKQGTGNKYLASAADMPEELNVFSGGSKQQRPGAHWTVGLLP